MDAPSLDDAHSLLHRRIGAILVEKELITADQLEQALAEHEATGKLVGEICVARFGVERIRLADVLAEQWDEMQREHTQVEAAAVSLSGQPVERVLRVLLDEARATRFELTRRTDELGRRLAALEDVVSRAGEALAALAKPARRSATRAAGRTAPKTATTRTKSRETTARPASSRAASPKKT